VHGQVSDALLELRAPLVRQLLQVAEPAPRLVPLTLLFELRVQLVLLIARRSEAAYRPFARAEKIFRSRINLGGDETKPQRYFFKDQTPAVLFQVAEEEVPPPVFCFKNMTSEGWIPSF